MSRETIAIASDHAGTEMKAQLKAVLEEQGHQVVDLGTEGTASVDYPTFADAVAAALQDGRAGRGVLICGTGIGISIAANRHRHVRAALCHDTTTARLSRQHNDANVLVLGARMVGAEVARDCALTFFATPFEGGRHARRVALLG
ncbi:MAG TPA: ribose 5-phosphate isomerase B [Azospirillaceae bacterium]|nr:ribose 5-phosphate isomerase B [Azospirillaceae bacterium]